MKYMRAIIFLLCGILFCSLNVFARDEVPGDINLKTAAQLVKQNKGNLVILDVRTPGEFAAGHLPHARNMDFFGGQFEKQMEELPKDGEYLLYCRSGRRSAVAAEMMQKKGIGKILHMHEGFQAWKKAGLPVESSKAPE